MKKQHKKGKPPTGSEQNDGFRIKSHNGSYGFVEGVKPPKLLISQAEARQIDACARRRRLKGVGCIQLPDYAKELSYVDDAPR